MQLAPAAGNRQCKTQEEPAKAARPKAAVKLKAARPAKAALRRQRHPKKQGGKKLVPEKTLSYFQDLYFQTKTALLRAIQILKKEICTGCLF